MSTAHAGDEVPATATSAQPSAAAEPASAASSVPRPTVPMELPNTGLKLLAFEGTTIGEAGIAGADKVKIPGTSGMVVKEPPDGRTLAQWIDYAKSREQEVVIFQQELFREGDGMTYTYAYFAKSFGKLKVVYRQKFQIDGKTWECYSGVTTEEAVPKLKAVCDTITKK